MSSGGRTVARVEDKVRLGPDAQVDDKAIIIMPKDPRSTDPFLALAEDWFSEPGFEWHPHRVSDRHHGARRSSRTRGQRRERGRAAPGDVRG
jgi:hypothetical protein